jgi:hypothetical protein
MKPEKIIKMFEEKYLDLEGDIKDALITLSKLLGEGFTKIDTEYDDDTKKFYACKYREETDAEYEERMQSEEKQRQRTLYYEKQMYEKLKKKFENEG